MVKRYLLSILILQVVVVLYLPFMAVAADRLEGVITTPGVKPGIYKGLGVYDMNCKGIGGGLTSCDGGIKTKEYGVVNLSYIHNMSAVPCINYGDRLELEVLDTSGRARVIRTAARTLTQINEGGGVEIGVTLLNVDALYSGEDILFEVAMNTHTVNLDQYRMDDISYLRDNKGRLFKAKAWESPKGGGHHRFGILRFPGRDSDGKEIIGSDDRYFEVVIKGVGGIEERVFRWELPFKIGL